VGVDLAVQQLAWTELAINLKTEKALGIAAVRAPTR